MSVMAFFLYLNLLQTFAVLFCGGFEFREGHFAGLGFTYFVTFYVDPTTSSTNWFRRRWLPLRKFTGSGLASVKPLGFVVTAVTEKFMAGVQRTDSVAE